MTLIELMVSMAIMGIVMTALVAVFIAVQQNYEKMSRSKSAIEGSRAVTAYLERTVRLAGYGLDPRVAFDFQSTGPTKDNGAVTGSPYNGVTVVTDDLAFRWRDPNYLRRGGISSGNLTVGASALGNTFGVAFPKFQRFLVMCPGGSEYAVYEANAAIAATASSAAVTLVAGNGFANTGSTCVNSTTGSAAGYIAVLQERRVRIFDVGGRPFLLAFRRIRNNAGAAVTPATNNADLRFDPIAADVEDFQVAYVMNRPGTMAAGAGAYRSKCCSGTTAIDSAGNANWILGDATNDPLPQDQTDAAGPAWDVEYDNAARYTRHSANIRQVRANVVVRAQRRDRGDQFSTPFSLENYARSSPASDGFLRLPMTTTIRVPNMISRSGFTPDLRTAAGEGNFNGG